MQSLVQTTDCRKFNLNKRMMADSVRTSAPPLPLKVSSHIIKDSTVRNRFTDDFHVFKVYLTKPIGHLAVD